jgi:hypothetical protein
MMKRGNRIWRSDGRCSVLNAEKESVVKSEKCLDWERVGRKFQEMAGWRWPQKIQVE